MPHFSIHQITASLSPKNVRSSLRLRRRKTSNASTTFSDMVSSPSNISIASSSIYRRHSIESIKSTSTAASSAIADHCDGLGITSPYYLPTIIKPSPKRTQLKTPVRKMTGSSIASVTSSPMPFDLFGFHHDMVDEQEEPFRPELALLEPRPASHRYCGFEEALEQKAVGMMPFRI